MKLRTKVVIKTLIPLILIFSSIFAFVVISIYQEEKANAIFLMETMAESFANEVQRDLEVPLAAARNIANTLEGFIIYGTPDRDNVNGILKKILAENDNFLGVWVGFEPDAFDGRDTEYMNAINHDVTGRFIPYWYRSEGRIESDALQGYNLTGEGDYYQLALNSGEERVLEPFVYEIDGENVLMTTFAVPIKVNGRTVGVAGVDLTLEQLQKIGERVKLYQSGFGRLISTEGITIIHPEKENIGELSREFVDGDASVILERVKEGKVFTDSTYSEILKENVFKSFAPVIIGDTNATWIFSTVVPEKEVFAQLNRLIQEMLVACIIGLVIVGGVLLLISKNIVKSISDITERIEEIANYDFTFNEKTKAVKYLDRKDEIGQIVRAIRGMRNNIVNLLMEITKGAETLASTAEELTAISEQTGSAAEDVARTIEEIAKGANEQAKDTEISVTNVEEMGNSIELTEGYIQELNASLTDINQRKEEGFEIINILIEKTAESSEAAKEIFEIILNNNESAEEIDRSSAMIQSIAEQTNLLALNAAIEAARAGDAGRGFAVVAEEIRKLAEETNSFTSEIGQVIEGLKIRTQGAVKTMEEVGVIVSEQADSVKETQHRFELIANSIETAGEVTQKLTANIQLLNSNKDKLIEVMQNLSAIAEENAAGTEEASAATEEQAASSTEIFRSSEGLSQIAEKLLELVNKFKI